MKLQVYTIHTKPVSKQVEISKKILENVCFIINYLAVVYVNLNKNRKIGAKEQENLGAKLFVNRKSICLS